MTDEGLGHADDISQLWGADDAGAWEPAPLRRPASPVPPRAPAPTGSGPVERLEALEHDVRALVEAVARVESLVDERLRRLEQQVEELAAKDRPSGHKGIGRLSGVIKSTRSH